MGIRNYIAIARPDHWFKNVFVLPGTLLAALLTNTPFNQFAWPLFIGLISVCLVASANYVINEWLDAEFDRFHPVKKNRPSVTGNVKASLVYTEYCILSVAGIGLALIVSKPFFVTIIALFVMGILYNVKPFRTKDRIYIDVLSESINNPIRLMLGWFIVTSYPLPPSSLVLGYWMGGAFLMAIKRYAEFRFIDSHELAGSYRRSFIFYTEKMFPAGYRNQVFIAEHGSWNRSKAAGTTGYRVTVVRLDGNNAVSYEPFMEGFLDQNRVLGRPVDLLIAPDGALLVSDDQRGVIYRIFYARP